MKPRKTRSKSRLRSIANIVLAISLAMWLGPAVATCIASAAGALGGHCERCPRAEHDSGTAHHHAGGAQSDHGCAECAAAVRASHCAAQTDGLVNGRAGGHGPVLLTAIAWRLPAAIPGGHRGHATGVVECPPIHPNLRFCVFLN